MMDGATKLALKLGFVFTMVVFLNCITSCDAGFPFNVYSGEHLDDLLIDAREPDKVDRDIMLIIHEKTCPPPLPDIHSLPLLQHLLILTHDYTVSQTHTWYGYNGDDIRLRYKSSRCLEAIYLEKGSDPHVASARWNPGDDLSLTDWMWKMLTMTLTVKNDRQQNIVFKYWYATSSDHEPQATVIDAGESVDVNVPRSFSFRVKNEEGHTVDGGVVNGKNNLITISDSPKGHFELNEIVKAEIAADNVLRTRTNRCAQRHAITLKLPLMMPNFTQTGFKKMKIPTAAYTLLTDFYWQNQYLAANEVDSTVETINYDKVMARLVPLTDEIKGKLSSIIKPILEEWSQSPLEFSYLYGIREYYHGNVLRMHLDKPNTHIISAILQVHQDLGEEGEDWELEVINWDGNREYVVLKSGEMLIYESAKLIHGRPKPLKGNVFANAFLHYRPQVWSNYYYENFIITAGDQIESVKELESSLTAKSGRKRDVYYQVDIEENIKSEL